MAVVPRCHLVFISRNSHRSSNGSPAGLFYNLVQTSLAIEFQVLSTEGSSLYPSTPRPEKDDSLWLQSLVTLLSFVAILKDMAYTSTGVEHEAGRV